MLTVQFIFVILHLPENTHLVNKDADLICLIFFPVAAQE